jgi:hypothetical protein
MHSIPAVLVGYASRQASRPDYVRPYRSFLSLLHFLSYTCITSRDTRVDSTSHFPGLTC